MKKTSFFDATKLALVGLMLVVGFSACKKTMDTPENIPASGLMAVNLANVPNGVTFTVGNNAITNQPLAYSNYTGGYLNIYTGSRQLGARDFVSGALLDSVTGNFEAGKYYSLFLIGSGSTFKNVLVADNIDTLTANSGQAYVRYINGIVDPSNPSVTLSQNGASVFNDVAGFGGVSTFKAVSPGTIDVAVKNESTVNKSRSITVEQRKIYTILLMGNPASANASDSAQIKFIVNGQIN